MIIGCSFDMVISNSPVFVIESETNVGFPSEDVG